MSMSLLVAFIVRATGRCRRHKIFGHSDGVVLGGVFSGVVSTVEDAFSPKIFELALCVAAF